MKVLNLFHLNKTEGDVGLEIETEGKFGFDQINAGAAWRCERDGSLRGDAIEFVLNRPVPVADVPKVVKRLHAALKDYELYDSGRAGLHVHLNMQKYTMTQVFNTLVAYMIFEDQLTEFCGEWRIGNLFCLRVCDADALLSALRRSVQQKEYDMFHDDEYRYAAVNVTALSKYGSLEFRSMRSTVDPKIIEEWVHILVAIRDWAVKFDNPIEIIQTFSLDGPDRVFEAVFGPAPSIEYNEEALYQGVRNAQYLAYATDNWEDVVPFDEAQDLLGHVQELEGFAHIKTLRKLLGRRELFNNDLRFSQSIVDAARDYLDNKLEIAADFGDRKAPELQPKFQGLGQAYAIVDEAVGPEDEAELVDPNDPGAYHGLDFDDVMDSDLILMNSDELEEYLEAAAAFLKKAHEVWQNDCLFRDQHNKHGPMWEVWQHRVTAASERHRRIMHRYEEIQEAYYDAKQFEEENQ